MSATVRKRGPLFSEARRHRIIDAACVQAHQAVAKVGNDQVHRRLHGVLRHPTGFYESHVVTDLAETESRVTDSGIIYGHWLEGTGSRNRTTRFKGYFTFRLITQGLRRDAGKIAEAAMTKLEELR